MYSIRKTPNRKPATRKIPPIRFPSGEFSPRKVAPRNLPHGKFPSKSLNILFFHYYHRYH